MSSQGGILAGKAFVELYANDNALVKGLNAAQAKLKAFGNALKAVGIGLTALGGAAITPILASARSFAEAADALDKMSQRTGVGVEALSEFSYAAEQSGVDMEQLENSVKHLQKTIFAAQEGSAEAGETFRLLGISLKQLKALTPEDQFKLVGDKLRGVQDPTRKAALAFKLFERSSTAIIPLINRMEELRAEGKSLGATMSKEDVAAGVELMNVYRQLKGALLGVVNAVGSAVAPILTEYGAIVVNIIAKTSKWIRDNKQFVVTALQIGVAVLAAGIAFFAFGQLLVTAGTILGTIATVMTTSWGIASAAFSAFAAVLGALFTPIGALFVALSALFGALVYYSGILDELSDTASSVFKDIKSFAMGAFQGIKDALSAGDIPLAANVLWAALKVAWYKGTSTISGIWIDFVYGLSDIFNNLKFDIQATLIRIQGFFDQYLGMSTTNAFMDAWDEAIGYVSKQMAKFTNDPLWKKALKLTGAPGLAYALLDSSSTPESEKQDRQTDRITSSKEAQRAQSAREGSRNGELASIANARDAANNLNKSQHDKDISDSMSDLAKAQSEFESLKAQAHSEAASAAGTKAKSQIQAVTPELDRIVRGDVNGTFSAASVGQLGVGNNIGERLVQAVERTAAATEKTASNTYGTGTFAQ